MDDSSSRLYLNNIGSAIPLQSDSGTRLPGDAGAGHQDDHGDDFADDDSALGDKSASETRSLTQSVLDYEYENGRRYHAYQAGKYPMPNDAEEQARMDMQHHLYLMLFGGELYRAPLPSRLRRVLDVGCGTGKWAFDFADSHAQTDVIGESVSNSVAL